MTAAGLSGRRIVITRAPHQAGEFARLLQRHGAEPLGYPCIAIVPPADTTALDSALRDALDGRFDWLLFTSANTVVALSQQLAGMSAQTRELARAKIAAVGPATADAVRNYLNLQAALMPEAYLAESLAVALEPVNGARILLPQSAIAPGTLAHLLTESGAEVTAVPAYRTVMGSGGADLPALLARREVDAITFTSSSTVANFLRRLEEEGGNRADLDGVCVACIGPKTAATARDLDLSVSVVPDEYTLEGLTRALEAHFRVPAGGR